MQRMLESQSMIGWRNLLEGLPSHYMRKLQQQHIIHNQLRSSGKKWTQAFLYKLFRLARLQREHRNEIKHRLKRPRHRRMIQQLHHSITEEMLAGVSALPLVDRCHFEENLVELLQKSLKFKQGWLLNVRPKMTFNANTMKLVETNKSMVLNKRFTKMSSIQPTITCHNVWPS